MTGILIPEVHGGAGQSLLEAVIVYEELGRALAPTPHFPSAVLAASVLLAAGSEAQQRDWLPRIASGEAIVTPAWLEPDGSFGPRGVQLHATPDGDGFRLSGRKRHVPFARAATQLLVLARTGPDDARRRPVPGRPGGPRHRAGAAALAGLRRAVRAGLRRRARARVGARRRGGHGLEDLRARACRTASCCSRRRPWAAPSGRSRSRWSTPRSASSSTSRSARSRRSRTTWPTPRRRSTAARPSSTRRPGRSSTGRDAAQLAAMAKLFACQTYRDVTAMCQQVWGGVGFTDRVRHPALLPPRQAAPALLVGLPGARGAHRGGRARRAAGLERAAAARTARV